MQGAKREKEGFASSLGTARETKQTFFNISF